MRQSRSNHQRRSVKKAVLRNYATFTGKHPCWNLFLIKLQFLQGYNHIKRTPTQVFSCEYCEIRRNTYFEKHLRTAVSGNRKGLNIRSSHPVVFCEKGLLRNFLKFTGKLLCQSLFFNKVAGLRPATLLKKCLSQRCFPVNFAKFLRTFFYSTPSWLLLKYWISLMSEVYLNTLSKI